MGSALFFSALFYPLLLDCSDVAGLFRAKAAADRETFGWCPRASSWNSSIITALLYQNYRAWLGFVVVLQALILLALCALWTRHSPEDTTTGQTLLLFALALVTAAIPIQLRFYGIPIGWSVEALLLGFVGQRYRNWQFQLGAFVATLLAALGLVARLPLHEALFTPVFNRPFGSWMTVIGMTFVLSAVLQKNHERLEGFFKQAVSAVFWLGVVLTCTLAHLEIATFWTVRGDRYAPSVLLSHELTSLVILWSAIPLVFLWLGRDRNIRASVPGAFIAYFIGILILLINATSEFLDRAEYTLPEYSVDLTRSRRCFTLGWDVLDALGSQ